MHFVVYPRLSPIQFLSSLVCQFSGIQLRGVLSASRPALSAELKVEYKHEHRDLLVGAILFFLAPEHDMRDFSIRAFKPQNGQLVAKEIVVGVALTIM